jgi:hypothetical protein
VLREADMARHDSPVCPESAMATKKRMLLTIAYKHNKFIAGKLVDGG